MLAEEKIVFLKPINSSCSTEGKKILDMHSTEKESQAFAVFQHYGLMRI